MLHDAIEKNERFLRFCGKTAHTMSFIIILFAFLAIAIPVSMTGLAHSNKSMLTNLTQPTFIFGYIKFLFVILFLLGIEQFIKCLIDIDCNPNWILRFGDKLIYLYALYIFVFTIYYNFKTAAALDFGTLLTSITIVFAIMKSLLWVGLGLVLKITVPIIQDSKTTI
jgi:hypothetical protein